MGKLKVVPGAGAPTSQPCPSTPIIGTSCVSVAGLATQSKTWSAPPVSARTASTGSVVLAFTACVAPSDRANSSLSSAMSTATIVPAWARSAPTIALTPTPPQPITTTLAPGSTRAAFSTAPSPVDTPHASVAIFSRETSLRTLTAAPSGTTARSANDDWENQ